MLARNQATIRNYNFEDVFVQGGNYSNSTFPSTSTMVSKLSNATYSRYMRASLFKINFEYPQDYNEPISAKLVFQLGTVDKETTVSLVRVIPFWSEKSVNIYTYNNVRPHPIPYVDTIGVVPGQKNLTFDMTSFIRNQNFGDYEAISFKLLNYNDSYVNYFTSESANKPYLELTYFTEQDPLNADSCQPVYPGWNNLTQPRYNIIYLPINYGTSYEGNKTVLSGPQFDVFLNDVKDAIDLEGNRTRPGGYGSYSLMELPVYKDNKNKFNFWTTNVSIYVGDKSNCSFNGCSCYTECQNALAIVQCARLPNTYIQNFCNFECRGAAYLGGTSWDRKSGIPGTNNHEFQHQVPMLLDEYYYSDGADNTRTWLNPTNCVNNMTWAQSQWGDLVGQTKDGLTTGYYNGCSYSPNNIRSTTESIMSASADWQLGLQNERIVKKSLWVSTTAVTGTENVYEVTLDVVDAANDVFAVKEVKNVNTARFNKPQANPTHKMTLNMNGKDYSQEFSVYDYLMTEGEGMTEIPKKQIIVDVVIPAEPAPTKTNGKMGIMSESTKVKDNNIEKINIVNKKTNKTQLVK